MTRLILAAAVAAVLTPSASAEAHVLKAKDRCEHRFTVKDYRSYASRVYKREEVSRKAHRRMRRMHRCQHSYRARKAVGRWHDRYVQERKERQQEAQIASSDAAWLASVRACEVRGQPDPYGTNTGNGFYGAYQFTLSSWQAVGGSGYPHQAPPAEQDRRALMLRDLQGTGAWPICG